MGREERKNYEESKGYMSFGRQCDEFYAKVDFDAFESIEEIKAFAASNDFIQLIEDENGEIILEKTLSANRDRYFINSDRLFQIGDFIYKIFEDGTASTHVDNLHKLVQNKSFSVYSIPEDTEITVTHFNPNRSTPNLKDATYNCGNSDIFYSPDNLDYRVATEVDVELRNYSGVHTYTILYVANTVKAFRKRWWGWAFSNRLLEYETKVAVDLETASGWEREFHKNSETRNVDGEYTHMLVQRWVSSGYHYQYDVHFGAYDCSVHMVNHEGVQVTGSCNVHIFPWGY